MKIYLTFLMLLILSSCRNEAPTSKACFLKCGKISSGYKFSIYRDANLTPRSRYRIRLENQSSDISVQSFENFRVNVAIPRMNLVELVSKEGVTFSLMNFDSVTVKAGQELNKSDTIGFVYKENGHLLISAYKLVNPMNKVVLFTDSLEVSPRKYLDCECTD